MHFTYYSCVVFILFNKDLYKSTCPTYSLKDLVFRLSVIGILRLFCFELDVLFIDL